MRLLAVVMGAPTDAARAEDSQRLLTYGFRFFKTMKLYSGGQTLNSPRVWSGVRQTVPAGIADDLYVTIPTGQYKNLKPVLNLSETLKAPIKKNQVLGDIQITLNNKIIAKRPLLALQADPKGGLWRRFRDGFALTIHGWFGDKA